MQNLVIQGGGRVVVAFFFFKRACCVGEKVIKFDNINIYIPVYIYIYMNESHNRLTHIYFFFQLMIGFFQKFLIFGRVYISTIIDIVLYRFCACIFAINSCCHKLGLVFCEIVLLLQKKKISGRANF